MRGQIYTDSTAGATWGIGQATCPVRMSFLIIQGQGDDSDNSGKGGTLSATVTPALCLASLRL